MNYFKFKLFNYFGFQSYSSSPKLKITLKDLDFFGISELYCSFLNLISFSDGLYDAFMFNLIYSSSLMPEFNKNPTKI